MIEVGRLKLDFGGLYVRAEDEKCALTALCESEYCVEHRGTVHVAKVPKVWYLKLSTMLPDHSSTGDARLDSLLDALNDLYSTLTCGVCLDVMVAPRRTKCGHAFCAECIHKAVRGAHPKCPMCNAKNVSKRSLEEDAGAAQMLDLFGALKAALQADLGGVVRLDGAPPFDKRVLDTSVKEKEREKRQPEEVIKKVPLRPKRILIEAEEDPPTVGNSVDPPQEISPVSSPAAASVSASRFSFHLKGKVGERAKANKKHGSGKAASKKKAKKLDKIPFVLLGGLARRNLETEEESEGSSSQSDSPPPPPPSQHQVYPSLRDILAKRIKMDNVQVADGCVQTTQRETATEEGELGECDTESEHPADAAEEPGSKKRRGQKRRYSKDGLLNVALKKPKAGSTGTGERLSDQFRPTSPLEAVSTPERADADMEGIQASSEDQQGTQKDNEQEEAEETFSQEQKRLKLAREGKKKPPIESPIVSTTPSAPPHPPPVAEETSPVAESASVIFATADLIKDKENEMNELASAGRGRRKRTLNLTAGKSALVDVAQKNRDQDEGDKQEKEQPKVVDSTSVLQSSEKAESDDDDDDDDLFSSTPQTKVGASSYRARGRQQKEEGTTATKATGRRGLFDAENKSTAKSSSSDNEPPTKIIAEGRSEEDDGEEIQEAASQSAGGNASLEQHRKFVVMCSGLTTRQRADVNEYCVKVGCATKTVMDAAVTHVIVGHGEDTMRAERTLKYLQAVAAGKLVVGFRWIEECLATGRLHLDPKDYEVLDVTGVEGPKRARQRRELGRPPLLDRFELCLVGGGFDGFIKAENLRALLTASGASVVRSVTHMTFARGGVCLAVADKDATAASAAGKKRAEYFKMFLSSDVAVVDKDWVLESLATYMIQPVMPFLQHNASAQEMVKAGYDESLLGEEALSCLLE